MTGKEVYNLALNNLGYQDNANIKGRILTIINRVYLDLHRLVYGNAKFKPIDSLGDTVDLPQKIIISAMSSGVAERIALGEGDGELQQYYALDYEKQKARINRQDKIIDVFSGG